MRRTLTITLACMLVLVAASAQAGQIHIAAANGDLARVQALVQSDSSLANSPDVTGATPLHWATAGGHRALVEFLLERGADVNAAKENGVTALHIAAGEGSVGLVTLLIAKGAARSTSDRYGRTPASVAKGRGHEDIARLLGDGEAQAPSTVASITGRAVSYTRTIVRGCPVNVIYVNLHDPKVQVGAAIAKAGIGSGESFSSFVDRLQPTVAVNGTFFSNSNRRPIGDIVIDGRLAHFGGMGTGLCIAQDNTVSFVSTARHRHTDWSKYRTVVCSGPRLVNKGRASVDARGEGFRDPHVLGIARRAAVGLTYMNRLVLVNTERSCSLSQLAAIMKDLGCTDAMNLDGGSSVAMHYRGRTITSPSRSLTNVLLIYEQTNAARASQ